MTRRNKGKKVERKDLPRASGGAKPISGDTTTTVSSSHGGKAKSVDTFTTI